MAKIMEECRAKAKEVAEFLQENHSGQTVTKIDIRDYFDIEWVKGSIIFGLLPKHGIIVSNRYVQVPERVGGEASSS